MDDRIVILKSMIQDYEESLDDLHEMIMAWEFHDDPNCDPGLQYEKGMEVEELYDEIKNYCLQNL